MNPTKEQIIERLGIAQGLMPEVPNMVAYYGGVDQQHGVRKRTEYEYPEYLTSHDALQPLIDRLTDRELFAGTQTRCGLAL